MRPETSLAHILNDFDRKVETAELEHVYEKFLLHKQKVKAIDVWTDDLEGKLEQQHTEKQAYNMAINLMQKEDFVNIHCYVFTGESFKKIIESLSEIGLIKYRIIGFNDVVKPFNEFIIILEKT